MLRKMQPGRSDPTERAARLQAERRLQVSAALALGAVTLLVIVLRLGVHNVFLPGWWRLW